MKGILRETQIYGGNILLIFIWKLNKLMHVHNLDFFTLYDKILLYIGYKGRQIAGNPRTKKKIYKILWWYFCYYSDSWRIHTYSFNCGYKKSAFVYSSSYRLFFCFDFCRFNFFDKEFMLFHRATICRYRIDIRKKTWFFYSCF